MEIDILKRGDCMQLFKGLEDNSVDLLLTDIPYDGVNRKSNGLRNLDKEAADIITFDMSAFLQECYRVTKSTVVIFCGRGQLSEISDFFTARNGTTRQIIWEKTNPSPMNGQHIYLSGIENGIWYKKKNGTFNAFCKNTVFRYPNGRRKFHPTEKNSALIKEIIADNSNAGDIVLDPCIGSGTTALCALELGRHFLGFELNVEYYEIAKKRVTESITERGLLNYGI